jgi:hypothetical protein
MFEVWSEGKSPLYSPIMTSLKPGTVELLGISWSQYGGKTGSWRFIRILDETEISATVCLNARVAELYADAVKDFISVDMKSRVTLHQDLILPYLAPQVEKDVIRRSKRIIEDAIKAHLPVGSSRWRPQLSIPPNS